MLVISPWITSAQLTPKLLISGKGNIGFYEFKPAGYDADSSYNYPLMIFLHGVGERGNGSTELPMALNSSFAKILVKGATMKFTVNGKQHAFVVLVPQMSKDYENWQNFYVDSMINYAKQHLKIDTNKIFLTGWSLGGGGAWKYATASLENARRLAGIIPVSPAPNYTILQNLAIGKVAVWAHHARDDASVPLHYTEDAIKGINEYKPDMPALITYYSSGGHPYVADWAYDTINRLEYPNVYQWMIGTSRNNNLANNLAPVASAGKDTAVILPSTSITLDGSASCDPNDVIVHYSWTMLSGPSSPNLQILQPGFPFTKVSGLEPGTYAFRLTVTDEFGTGNYDDVSVKVILPANGQNAHPVVYAGPDVAMAQTSWHQVGKGRDFDGQIVGFEWRQISGPVNISISNSGSVADIWGMSQEGVYGLELSAYDNHKPAGIGKDTIFITKNLPLPVNFYFLTRDDPTIKNGDLIRYGMVVVFFTLLLIPTLIFKEINMKNR